jgi:hypothetical protein
VIATESSVSGSTAATLNGWKTAWVVTEVAS